MKAMWALIVWEFRIHNNFLEGKPTQAKTRTENLWVQNHHQTDKEAIKRHILALNHRD